MSRFTIVRNTSFILPPAFILPPSAFILPPSSFHLVHRALPRFLLRAPAKELRAVAEAALREIVVFDFADELRLHRLPLAGALGRPAARASGHAHFERVFAAQGLEPLRQLRAVVLADRRRVADVHEPSLLVVQPEE